MKYLKNTLLTVSGLAFMQGTLLFGGIFQPVQPQITVATQSMSLKDRYAVESVNNVMRDNILLNLAYIRGIVPDKHNIDWNSVRKPFEYTFELKPGETFAYQKDALPEYKDSIVKTTDINFGASDGFKSDGYLYGDGVCHLASLFYWAAKDAGLDALAPTNHNFAVIPEIPAQYGVAIYSQPGETSTNANQNLYVRNDNPEPVSFKIAYDGERLTVKIVKEEQKISADLVSEEVI